MEERRQALRGTLRLLVAIPAIALITVVLLPFQILAAALKLPGARIIPLLYHRLVCAVIRLRVHRRGIASLRRPLLILANHVSWLDIPVIGAIMPVVFVAKRDVADWPLFGVLAKLQPSVFVDRERVAEIRTATSEIARTLLAGNAVVLFAEGTSGDGNEILPFRSALVGAAENVVAQSAELTEVSIQPLSILYVGKNKDKAVWPWYDPIDIGRHMLRVLRNGNIEVVVTWGEPLRFDGRSDRKEVVKRSESAVRDLTAEARHIYEKQGFYQKGR
jgi:1-acyl-sn-glycerol-3-phosphate acyltransferase